MNLKPIFENKSSLEKKKIKIDKSIFDFDSNFPNYTPITLKLQKIGNWQILSEERCSISYKKLTPETTVRCPNCQSPFDQRNWRKWIKKKHTCPVCRANIAPTGRKSYFP